jgi:hypothetical protein
LGLLFPSEYKAGLDGALDRPDVPVFPLEAAVHLDLRLRPFLDAADIHLDAESLWDADRVVAGHPVCFDMGDAVLEDLHRQGLMAVGAGKLAGRARLPAADAVLDRLEKVLIPEHPAWSGSAAARLAELADAAVAAPELYKPGAVQSAA